MLPNKKMAKGKSPKKEVKKKKAVKK